MTLAIKALTIICDKTTEIIQDIIINVVSKIIRISDFLTLGNNIIKHVKPKVITTHFPADRDNEFNVLCIALVMASGFLNCAP